MPDRPSCDGFGSGSTSPPPPFSAAFLIFLSVGAIFLPPIGSTAGRHADRGRRAIHARHSRLTIRTTFGRFRRPSLLRSSIVIRPSREARLRTLLARARHTPALAASSASVRAQCPCWRTSSDTILRTASSPTVKRQANDGGIGPEAARCRRRVMAIGLCGGRWSLLGGKIDGRPAAATLTEAGGRSTPATRD